MDADEPTILLPCAICARTFTPQSLEKHVKICERAAAKKRKPFDSAKQRIQGTDLAEFIPKQEKKPRNYYEYRSSKPTSSWKQSHDDFLRAIRAARDNLSETSVQQQTSNVTSARGPTRANEKGVCPTCNRQFGIKAYDRHVIWCKERATRLPISQATNAAKERLEARMKYRAPALKNRRAKNREKYSPGSTMSLNRTSKMALPAPNNLRLKETNSLPNHNKPADVLAKQKSSVTRLEQQENPSEHMKSLAVDRTNSGIRKDYDPFSLAEQQMNELLSDTSDSTTDGLTTSQTRKNLFPLSHSSAFVKYPSQEVTTPATTTITTATTTTTATDTRMSMIAPPTEFDDLTSDFSSDSTETNSLSRETFINELKEFKDMQEFDKIYKEIKSECKNRSSGSKELGRRVIIDKSKVLGGEMVTDPSHHRSRSFVGSTERARKILDKVSPKVVRPTTVNRSNLVRVCSAPKPATKRNISDAVISDAASDTSNSRFNEIQSYRIPILNNTNNNDVSLSASNLCKNSIVSSESNIKRSNSVFDDLISSFEDNVVSFSSSGLHMKKDSLSMSSPIHGRRITHNGQISDEELSSPDGYQRQDHGKFNADSAYSSLNRRYSNQSAQVNGETTSKNNNRRASNPNEVTKSKMSNFCHECGSKFPKTAKYCCECGMKRLIL